MAKPQLLLVDADLIQLRLLEVSLKSEGFNVTVATDGMDAWEKLCIAVPDVLVAGTQLPRVDGYELVRRLREQRETAALPVIFLSSSGRADGRTRAIELGVEDYLPRPILVRELVSRAHALLAKRIQRELGRVAEGGATRYSCSLSEVGLVDLLQIIAEGRKDGVAHVTCSNRELVMYFQEGRVLDAFNGQLRGEEAIYRALLWSEGRFELETGHVEAEETISTSTQGLLLEGMRRLDEMGRIAEQLPSMSAAFDFVPEVLRERLGEIPDEINGILQLLDGERTLSDLLDLSPFDDLSTLSILSKLFFDGVLVQVGVAGRPVSMAPDVRDALKRTDERRGEALAQRGSSGETARDVEQSRPSFRPSAPPMVGLRGSLAAPILQSASLSNAFERADAESRRVAETPSVAPRQVPAFKRTDPGIAAIAALPTLSIGGRVGSSDESATPPAAPTEREGGAPPLVGRDTLRPGAVRSVDLSKPSYAFEESWRVGSVDSIAPSKSLGRVSFDTLIQGTPVVSQLLPDVQPELAPVVHSEPAPVVEPEPRARAAAAALGVAAVERPGTATIAEADVAEHLEPAAAADEAAWESAWHATDDAAEPPVVAEPRRRWLPWLLVAVLGGVLGIVAFRSLTTGEDAQAKAPSDAPKVPIAEALPADNAAPPPPAAEPPSQELEAAASAPLANTAPEALPKPSVPRHSTPFAAKVAVKAAPKRSDSPTLLPSVDLSKGSKRPPTARFPAPAAN